VSYCSSARPKRYLLPVVVGRLLLRHGLPKVPGWWAPLAPGLRAVFGQSSLSKHASPQHVPPFTVPHVVPLGPLRAPLMQGAPAYGKLRVERMNARMVGVRAKKAKEAAKEAEA
jgi:hypothetical protein